MQTYLFAANLLTLTAFLVGLNHFSRGVQSWRLAPLFLLVMSQSLSLIISLTGESTAIASLLAALSIFSTICLVWALTNMTNLPVLWQKLAWLGGSGALILAILPLIPDWPIPFQIHAMIVTMAGTFFILSSLDQMNWSHLAAPFLLAAANLFSLLALATVSWLATLLAYGLLVAALHWESVQIYRRREKATEAAARQAASLSQERQRLLEVSEIISAVPGLEQSLTHLVRSMAHITHSDQSAIFTLDVDLEDWVRLIAIYSPERPVYLTGHDEITFDLDDCPPLQTALTTQRQQLFNPYRGSSDLESLYGLWNEHRTGPTLIQPLTVQGRSIGALVLGNPVSHHPLREDDRVLCRSLASQMATMVEAYRRYIDLELRAEQKKETTETTLLTVPPPERLEIKPDPALEADLRLKSDATVPSSKSLLRTAASPARRTAEVLAAAAEPTPAGKTEKKEVGQDFGRLGKISPARPGDTEPSIVLSPKISAEPTRPDTPTEKPAAVLPEVKRDSTEDYLAILETIEEGVVVSNGRGQVQLVNKAAEHILGKSRQELLGQPIAPIYGAINSTEKIENLAAAFSRRNEPLPTFIESNDRTIQGQLIPWRNEEKEWLGIVAIFKDVTQTIKADQARNNFTMALSRVLRGPLTLIKGYAELTTTGLLEEYSPEQLKVQKIIHNSVERVVEILDNAIQISSQNKNKILPRFESVDITRIIDKALQEITSFAYLRKVRLIREVKEDLPLIIADQVHLYRILENLLSNACRFTPPGGRVTVRAWVQQERVGNITRPQLILAVADNGVGIPKSELKRIFEPFYQLNNQPPGEERGMGMGLAVVKELVELHRGRVWVESTVGEGSIFQVALPVSQN